MANDTLFRSLAPRIMRDLMQEFPWAVDDAAACLGNGGHESGGFKSLQEGKPMVAGSRGGWGYFQWTGPRRRNFEAWVKAQGLDPSSYEANYGFLVHELKTSEKATIAKVKAAKGLEAKVKAFELAFERAGVKHYDSRLRWAEIALAAYGRPAKAKASPLISQPEPAAPSPAVDPAKVYDDKDTVIFVQSKLRALGYSEVGTADGNIGDFTRKAIVLYRGDRGLPYSDRIDDELILKLATDKDKRQQPAGRADATPAEVRERVPEAQATWTGKITGYVTAGFSAIGAAVNAAWDNLGEAKGYLEPIKDFVGDVPIWVWLAAIGGGAFVLSRKFAKGEKASIEAFQEGARR